MRSESAFLLGLVLLVGATCARAQDPPRDETIKVETRFVSVPTIVSDRNGRYVANLTQKDFTIFQDGQQQSIEFFAATEEPINVALLIDTSQSTRGVIDDIRDSAKSFIKLLTPKDKAMIVAFDYDVHLLCPLTSDQNVLRYAAESAEIPPQGMVGTKLRDAVYDTINRTFAGLKGRKAIILLTDGKDAGSRIRTDTLLYSLQESDTLVYTVMFKTKDNIRVRGAGPPPPRRDTGGPFGRFPSPEEVRREEQQERIRKQMEQRMERQNAIAQEFLNSLSDTTAGRAFSSKDGKVKKTFADIVQELRYQYRLGFYPPEDDATGALHQIKVKINRTDAVVRSRGSYRAVNK